MPRSEDYPLDVSTRFTKEQRFVRLRGNDAIHGLVVSPSTGDVTNDALAGALAGLAIRQHLSLAYVDVIDLNVESTRETAARIENQVQTVATAVTALSSAIEQLRQSQAGLFAALGAVVVPAWTTEEEVENGDDMALVVFGAQQLGLVVEYVILQREPGFAHQQVVSIDPPAGSVVMKGSTVKVTINLEG